jgi:long-chain fatty acid transport protein
MTVARRSWSLALAAVAGVIPSAAQAQGFGLNEIGSCAVGRGFSVTARPCADASTLFWNPAAAVRLEGLNLYAGAAAVGIAGDFIEDISGRDYDADVPLEVPPHLFASYRVSPRVAAGLGVYVPYGLTSQWRDDFPGRFLAIRASLATIYVQPTVAVDVIPNRLAIGGGPIFGHSTVELYQAIDLSSQAVVNPTTGIPAINPFTNQVLRFRDVGIPVGTEFARAKLQGDANAWGAQFGAQLKVSNTLDVGVRWLWALYFEYDEAEATFEQTMTRIILGPNNPLQLPTGTPIDALVQGQFSTAGTVPGALTTRPGSSAIKHPGQVQVGLNYSGIARTNLSLDYTWFSWSDFDVLPVSFGGTNPPPSRTIIEDFDDAHRIGVGFDHVLDNRLIGGRVNNWAIRAGFSAAKTPAPDYTVTPLLPDQDRKNYNVGVGIPLGARFGLDLAYLRVDTDGRRGRIVERENATQTAAQLNSGFYRLDANIWNASIRARF